MLNRGWNVFKEVLHKKQEVLDTFLKPKMMNQYESKFFLGSLQSWSQFQGKIFRTCVSISVGLKQSCLLLKMHYRLYLTWSDMF